MQTYVPLKSQNIQNQVKNAFVQNAWRVSLWLQQNGIFSNKESNISPCRFNFFYFVEYVLTGDNFIKHLNKTYSKSRNVRNRVRENNKDNNRVSPIIPHMIAEKVNSKNVKGTRNRGPINIVEGAMTSIAKFIGSVIKLYFCIFY